MPVFHTRGYGHGVARAHLHGRLALLLIPARAGDADQQLAAALGGMVYVPVVAAVRLESHVYEVYAIGGDRVEIAVAGEVSGIRRIWLADREYQFALKEGSGVGDRGVVAPHLQRLIEGSPSLGPAGVESHLGEYLGDFGAGHAVFAGRLQVICERAVGDTAAYKRRDRHDAAVAQRQAVGAAPYLTEKHIVVEPGKFRREAAQAVAAGSLYDVARPVGKPGRIGRLRVCHIE